MKLFPRNLRQAGGYATAWLNRNFFFKINILHVDYREIPRDGCVTIPNIPNFVIGAFTNNARLTEADSKADRLISLRIRPPQPVRGSLD
ncbi:hypothetical protein JQ628_07380 [Bradyrhizobium lablabi]|uniref:hypothetical protein n=1 Tax=Bradyrhizobium lablabi TaxID=722472 RepID=UPI001BA7627D|nr:hypothetical protein [Bradyrhizobium lablabi]MBR1121332.1 hypothetical protein [Bradyrhizobium lablabi]